MIRCEKEPLCFIFRSACSPCVVFSCKIIPFCISMALSITGRERKCDVWCISSCGNTVLQTVCVCVHVMDSLCDPPSGNLLPSYVHWEAQMLCI